MFLISKGGSGVGVGWGESLSPSYEAESKAKAKRLAGRRGPDPAAGRQGSWRQRGRVHPSLPHVARVPVLVELVEVVGVPGERAQPR